MIMLRRFSQAIALVVLCVLLVYAPEIFTAVSAPYHPAVPERTLLRAVLCTTDAQAASSFYKALNGFKKAHDGVHTRVTRASAEQMLALGEPLPDVYLFPDSLSPFPEGLLLPLDLTEEGDQRSACPFQASSGETLLCGVGLHAREPELARALVAYLYAQSAPAGQPEQIAASP